MPAQIDPFHAIAIGALAHRLAAEGRSIIHMEYGQPSTGAPAAAIAAAHRVLDSDPLGYWESPALKERIARSYAEDHGVAVAPEQVILTCGASPALLLALNTLFAPGDRVALARPGYVAYRNTLKALHIEPVEIECGEAARFQLTAAALAALDPAPDGVIIASPANPTGTVIARAEMAAIAEICAARGIRIVSDEIYHGLSYVGPVDSILRFAPDALVVNSFSKYFSMVGWRLGWLVVPEALVPVIERLAQNLFICPSTIAQHAALACFEPDSIADYEHRRAEFKARRDYLAPELNRLGLTVPVLPDGAFYAWADCSAACARLGIKDSWDFTFELLNKAHVAVTPGRDFGQAETARFIRFSSASAMGELRTAVGRIAAMLG